MSARYTCDLCHTTPALYNFYAGLPAMNPQPLEDLDDMGVPTQRGANPLTGNLTPPQRSKLYARTDLCAGCAARYMEMLFALYGITPQPEPPPATTTPLVA